MNNVTFCITTARSNPEIGWIVDSIKRQTNEPLNIMVIDATASEREVVGDKDCPVRIFPPKPNVWQGKHRLTSEDWWAVCNARNTALCLVETPYICFLDDRCVLQPGFVDAIKRAIDQKYIMAGAYEKRVGMTVENGVIKHGGTIIGTDVRELHGRRPCVGQWLFGCCVFAPVEWLLRVNGYPEILCDSMSFEDVIMGIILQNNHYPIWYDPGAKLIEDRSPEFLSKPMKRSAKERFPNDKQDKAHTALRKVTDMKRSENPFGSIIELRKKILSGEEFPVLNLPSEDWFDGMKIGDFSNVQ